MAQAADMGAADKEDKYVFYENDWEKVLFIAD